LGDGEVAIVFWRVEVDQADALFLRLPLGIIKFHLDAVAQ